MCLSSTAYPDLFDRNQNPQRLFADFNWDKLLAFPMESDRTDTLFRIRDDWLTRLKILRAGHGSSFFPSEAQIAGFTTYLVAGQRNKLPSLLGPMSDLIGREPYLEWLPAYRMSDILHSRHDEIEHFSLKELQTALDASRAMCDEEFNLIISSLAVGETGDVSVTIKVKG